MRPALTTATVLLASMPAFALWTYGAESLQVESAPLRSRTWLLRGLDGQQTVLARGDRSGMLVDTLSAKERPHLQRAAEARLEGAPLRHLALTSHRPIATAGLGGWPSGVQTIAHSATAQALRHGDRPGDHPGADVEFPGTLTVRLGELEANLWHKGPAHTSGATLVYFVEDQVLAVGDLVTPGRHPEVLEGDGGSLRNWVQVLNQLLRDFADNDALLVVPARGGYGDAQLLRDQLDYLQTITDRVDAAWRNGLTLDELLGRMGPLEARLANRQGELEPVLRWAYAELGS